jgi:3-hydroxyisobutyrate dehydrogenase
MRLAQIGLGAMGLPIAHRLAAADGIELTVYDADARRVAQFSGLARPATSVAEAIQGADAIVTVLPADAHVRSVVAEVVATAERGQVFADLSTIAPATIEEVATELAGVGVRTLSVAITRGTAAAERGELGLFVGGDDIVLARLRPVLEAISNEIRPSGDLGSAKAVKIANNMVVGVLDIAICEALVLTGKVGLDRRAVTTHLRESGADGWALRNHIVACVLEDDLGPGHFSTANMAKDIALFIELAMQRGTPALLAGTAAACYRGTIALGYAADYHPVVIRWLEAGAAAAAARPTGSVDRAAVLNAISGGVVALQTLANIEALQALRETGISTIDAAEHLMSGSAANDSLLAVAHSMTINARALAGELERLLDLAEVASVPALMFETARHAALVRR